MSSGPPAAEGTIQRTGRCGYGCADVMLGVADNAKAHAAHCRRSRRRRSIAVYPKQLNLPRTVERASGKRKAMPCLANKSQAGK